LGGTGAQWTATLVMLGVCAFTALPLVMGLLVEKFVLPKIEDSQWYLPLQTTTWALYAVCIFIFVRMDAGDFIYFQF
jgi:uncharacterized membrane protein